MPKLLSKQNLTQMLVLGIGVGLVGGLMQVFVLPKVTELIAGFRK